MGCLRTCEVHAAAILAQESHLQSSPEQELRKFGMFTAIRRASSRVSELTAARWLFSAKRNVALALNRRAS